MCLTQWSLLVCKVCQGTSTAPEPAKACHNVNAPLCPDPDVSQSPLRILDSICLPCIQANAQNFGFSLVPTAPSQGMYLGNSPNAFTPSGYTIPPASFGRPPGFNAPPTGFGTASSSFVVPPPAFGASPGAPPHGFGGPVPCFVALAPRVLTPTGPSFQQPQQPRQLKTDKAMYEYLVGVHEDVERRKEAMRRGDVLREPSEVMDCKNHEMGDSEAESVEFILEHECSPNCHHRPPPPGKRTPPRAKGLNLPTPPKLLLSVAAGASREAHVVASGAAVFANTRATRKADPTPASGPGALVAAVTKWSLSDAPATKKSNKPSTLENEAAAAVKQSRRSKRRTAHRARVAESKAAIVGSSY